MAVASAGPYASLHLAPDSTSPLSFYRSDALPAAQQTASKHRRLKNAYDVVNLFSEKIVNLMLPCRCQILRLKCTKFDFRWSSAPDPTAQLIALPSCILGDLLLKGGSFFNYRKFKFWGVCELAYGNFPHAKNSWWMRLGPPVWSKSVNDHRSSYARSTRWPKKLYIFNAPYLWNRST